MVPGLAACVSISSTLVGKNALAGGDFANMKAVCSAILLAASASVGYGSGNPTEANPDMKKSTATDATGYSGEATSQGPSQHGLEEIKQALFTAVLSDVLDALGCTGQVAAPGINPLSPGMRVVGRVSTARGVTVAEPPREPYGKLLAAIDALQPGRVLLISMDGTSTSGVFGGLLATAVAVAGGEGVIVDGYARDADEIDQVGLPTFVRGLCPLDSYGRDDVVEIGGPVVIAGVVVHDGDLVFADRDGIVFVPSSIEQQVIERAFEKVHGEGEVRQALRGGMAVTEAFAKFGIL
ncbi:MAG: RraA family protein [Aeromicrobium sp.]